MKLYYKTRNAVAYGHTRTRYRGGGSVRDQAVYLCQHYHVLLVEGTIPDGTRPKLAFIFEEAPQA